MTEQVREALAESGVSLTRLEEETGVFRASARRFLNGDGITSDNLDKIAAWLRIEAKPMAGGIRKVIPRKGGRRPKS